MSTPLEAKNSPLSAILEAIPQSVIVTDTEGRVVSWNRAATDLYGYSADDAIGRAITELLQPVSVRRDAIDVARDLSRDERRAGAEVVRAAGGREIPIHYETAAVLDEAGHVVGTVGLSRSPHHSSDAERIIRRNTETHRMMFQSSPTPKWIIDRETLRFLDVNDTAVELYGYSHAEFLTMTLEQLHVGDAKSVLHDWLGASATRPDLPRHIRHRTKAGRELELSVARQDVEYVGRRARLVSVIDLTEQHAAERELRKSEALFRTLTENAFEIMTISTLEGRFTMTSSARALGYAPNDVIGRTFADFVHPDDLPRLSAAVAEIAAVSGGRKHMEVRCRDAEGRWRMLAGSLLNFLDHPAIGGIVSLCRDVTDQRATEQALRESELQLQHAQKLEAVGRLAGGVAHDFNNLLTAIRGYTELVRASLPVEHEAHPELGEVLSAVDRAAALTKQLLAYSRRQLLQPTTLCLADVVRGIEGMLRRIVYENITLEVVVEPDVPLIVADESQLHQVLLNLVVNARDAMQEGGLLSVHVYPAELDTRFVTRVGGSIAGSFAAMAVIDNGAGMTRETREHIFEPFFTTKPPGAGTGLGLSMVYGMVQQSGGYIDVHSEPGRGTRFELYFPAAAADERVTLVEAPPAAPPAERGDACVLVVEDSASVRAIARRALQAAGYRVLDARDGVEALEVLSGVAGNIDMIIVDLIMPRMGGVDLIRRLRDLGFDGAILAMTGYADRLRDVAGELPDLALRTIEKPFTMSALVARVQGALREHCARASTSTAASEERVA